MSGGRGKRSYFCVLSFCLSRPLRCPKSFDEPGIFKITRYSRLTRLADGSVAMHTGAQRTVPSRPLGHAWRCVVRRACTVCWSRDSRSSLVEDPSRGRDTRVERRDKSPVARALHTPYTITKIRDPCCVHSSASPHQPHANTEQSSFRARVQSPRILSSVQHAATSCGTERKAEREPYPLHTLRSSLRPTSSQSYLMHSSSSSSSSCHLLSTSRAALTFLEVVD